MNAPVEVIWQRLIDFPGIPSWEGGVLEVRQVSTGPPGVGTKLVARRVYAGRESTVDCEITAWDDGQGATMSIRGGPMREASVRYAVEPAPGGRAVVAYSAEGAFRGAWRLLTPLVGIMGRRQVQSNLSKLKRQVEVGGSRSGLDVEA